MSSRPHCITNLCSTSGMLVLHSLHVHMAVGGDWGSSRTSLSVLLVAPVAPAAPIVGRRAAAIVANGCWGGSVSLIIC